MRLTRLLLRLTKWLPRELYAWHLRLAVDHRLARRARRRFWEIRGRLPWVCLTCGAKYWQESALEVHERHEHRTGESETITTST